MAEHDLARSYCFGRDTGIGLEAHTQIRRSTTSPRPTYDLISRPQGDGGPRGCRQMLGALRNCADGRFQIEFGGMNLNLLVVNGYGSET